MKAVGREEKQHAIKQNNNYQGVPAISVIVDGASILTNIRTMLCLVLV